MQCLGGKILSRWKRLWRREYCGARLLKSLDSNLLAGSTESHVIYSIHVLGIAQMPYFSFLFLFLSPDPVLLALSVCGVSTELRFPFPPGFLLIIGRYPIPLPTSPLWYFPRLLMVCLADFLLILSPPGENPIRLAAPLFLCVLQLPYPQSSPSHARA